MSNPETPKSRGRPKKGGFKGKPKKLDFIPVTVDSQSNGNDDGVHKNPTPEESIELDDRYYEDLIQQHEYDEEGYYRQLCNESKAIEYNESVLQSAHEFPGEKKLTLNNDSSLNVLKSS